MESGDLCVSTLQHGPSPLIPEARDRRPIILDNGVTRDDVKAMIVHRVLQESYPLTVVLCIVIDPLHYLTSRRGNQIIMDVLPL